ncbi:pectate lyase family protein [Allorhizocola rhizosphaerae]|uniref:pectate lyase family protein n=1 Tax=Allorhizocola rhizosphaerae TaxID=1872709 RepID=UPI000E3C228D|nr:pectate lyase [Allorhizocola rhizosphaerae]
MRAKVIVAVTTAVVTATALWMGTANAATLFSDDFNDGNADGWTRSGGTWVVSSGAYTQTGTGSDAKAQAGSTSWTAQSVTARVRPTAWGSNSNRAVGVAARATGLSTFYSLVLTQSAVQIRRGTTVLTSASFSVSTGTWYTLKLNASGQGLTGFVNGGQVLSTVDGALASGRAGFVAGYAAAQFDDILVTDEAGPSPSPSASSPNPSPSVSPSGSPSPTPSVSIPPMPNVADGYAGVNAWGQNGTSGGAGGSTVDVNSASAFLSAIANPNPLVIRVNGMISLPGPMHDVTSHKTIIGVGANSGLTGGGLNIGLPLSDSITSPPANAVRNVIVRNLNITNCPDDCINVQMFSHHIWIDHNQLGNQNDGALDVKRGSSYVTISWNRFANSDKNMLLGHDDSNDAQDVGRLKVTYHHNFLDGSNQRNPRVRFGEPVHIYNNYYLHITGYGAASQMNACLVVENNYFDDVEKPTRNDVGGTAGRIEARGNINVNTEDPIVTAGSCTSQPRDYYSYTLDPAANIPALVSAGAGVGKI